VNSLLIQAGTLSVTLQNAKYDDALAELEKQGLTVRLHSRENNTWHISDHGLYSGYVARRRTVKLKRTNS
jgi:hypothetical protein